MPTTFTVFSLGQLQIWDTAEGNTTVSTVAVNNALGTYGSAGDPLFDDRATFAPAGNGFAGGNAGTYDLDNNVSNDQFSINGGPPQTFDASMTFTAEITYTDGETATITAVVFQDTNGNTYWAPELTNNADQDAIELKAIQSIELISPIYSNGQLGQGYGLTADRVDSQPKCFTTGTMIACPDGARRIDDLCVGDLVDTMDHGPQPIRWIGQSRYAAIGRLAPIHIKAGFLDATADLEVSPQHRILLSGPQAELLFGEPEVFAPAKSLVDGNAVSLRVGGEVTYFHLLFDQHEILWANGVASESLFLGEVTTGTMDQDSMEEIRTIFPELRNTRVTAHQLARPTLRAYEAALWADMAFAPDKRRQVG